MSRRRRRGSSRATPVWGGSSGRSGGRPEEQQFGFVASVGISTSGRRPAASCRHSCAAPAGKRNGRVTQVVPDGEAPGQPMEFHGSVRHHQVSSSVGRCRRGGAGSIWVHGVLVGGRSEGRQWEKPAPAGRPATGLGVDAEGRAGAWSWRGGRRHR
jgi:hypothetical protein